MKKLTIGLLFSAALLSFSSTAEASTQVQPKYITNFNQTKIVKRKHVYQQKVTSVVIKKKQVVIEAASAPADDTPPRFRLSNVLAIANRWIGSTETRNRRQLTEFMGIDPKRTPWCAGFVGAVLEKSGRNAPDTLQAAGYLHYGVRTRNPSPGDIVVVRNGRGKHVGFYVQTVTIDGQKYVKVLGGNQDNSVKYHLYPVTKVVQYRTEGTRTASL